MNRRGYRILGVTAWAFSLAAIAVLVARSDEVSISAVARTTAVAILDRSESFTVNDPLSQLRPGDPVFAHPLTDADADPSGQRWKQIGSVVTRDPETRNLTIAWHDPRSPQRFRLVAQSQTGRLDEVLATMLPPDQRARIEARLSDLLRQHGQETAEAMMPLVEESLRRSMPVIQSALETSVAQHRLEIDHLAARWNDEIVRERLVPLAKEELLPIVRKHAQPQIESIGRELWGRASVVRFGWRFLYDKSPLPDKELVQEEWDRFVEEEAVPVIEEHTDELVATVQATIQEIAKSDRLRDELGQATTQMFRDPQSRALIRMILQETLIDNDALRKVLQEVWTSPQAKRILDGAADKIEPVVREIGDDLFGTPQTGIHPNFARVLRSQVLGKDRRFVIAQLRPAGLPPSPVIEWSREPMPYPVVYLANPEPVAAGRDD